MKLWNPLRAAASRLTRNDMSLLGIDRTMRVAKTFNRLRYGSYQRQREEYYRKGFEQLLAEHANGSKGMAAGRMNDGWFLDNSGSFPYLEQLIADAEVVIAERGGQPPTPTGKPFINDIAKHADLDRFPSFLNFALSTPVLKSISDYLGFVPVLSTTMPPGLRLTESSSKFDRGAGGPYRESQLYHLDHHDSPLVYVIVLLREVTMASGPFTFLPASVSARAATALKYRERNAPYRITDEKMYSVIGRNEAIPFTGAKGSVLFLDSSRCFHYGSRDCAVPRYQMMYAFVSPCRTDFSEILMRPRAYSRRATDSQLRRLVLDKTYRA